MTHSGFAWEDACRDELEQLGVPFIYEATEYVISLKPNGDKLEAFRPDFYIPELDGYVEVTAAKNTYKKRRKIRRLAASHPEVRVVLCSRSSGDTMASSLDSLRDLVLPA